MSGRQYTNAEKVAFLEAVERNGGVILGACKAMKIGRTTHYEWLKEPWYKQLYEDIIEEQKDFVESQLLKNIKKGDSKSIIFYLKSKAKDRGYYEKIQNDNIHEIKGRAYKIVKAKDYQKNKK